ncbi:ABC transporter permease [Candidatus Aerophobetes bacterium]|uniref:ABC transporter permease n=1 Tax=Aerophobetes bacterium TaxID=2030807 RepID=A0A662DLE8_UNCAE|nr:MAG: ABC transporter permease [Candidatus Aerophobetes bacterium]
MGLKEFVIKKIIAAIITIFAIVSVNFVIFRMAPGDPVRMMFRDPRISGEQMQLIREKFGLDKPLWGQFIFYLKELSHGDLGLSFWQRRPVREVIAERIPQTLLLVLTALAIAMISGTILGAFSGWKRGTRVDSFILALSLTMYSIPAFSLGIILLLIFAYTLSIFPLGGMTTPASGLTGLGYWKDVLWHMCLPAFSIVMWYIGEYVLLTRSSMLDTLRKDYILTARAKGLKESTILINHALRNALLPVITITGVNIGFAVCGVIEVETVFSWPGIGRLVYDAVMKRDYPLLQGLFLVFAISVVLANLVIDLIYGYIDPRIKVGGEKK